MEVKEFKQKLKRLGVKWKQFEDQYDPEFAKNEPDVEQHIKSCTAFDHVISWAFDWKNTEEGFSYWATVSDGLPPGKIIADYGEIVSNSIVKDGHNWIVGCQTITRKQRLKLFKLLADDLGYELS